MSAPISQRILGLGNAFEKTRSVEAVIEQLRNHKDHHRKVIVAQLGDNITAAMALFKAVDLHHLPVVEGSKVKGIVSATDLLELFSSSPMVELESVTLHEIMTENPITIEKEAPITEAIRLLATNKFRCLPVVNNTGEIWDIITTRDLVRYLHEHFEA